MPSADAFLDEAPKKLSADEFLGPEPAQPAYVPPELQQADEQQAMERAYSTGAAPQWAKNAAEAGTETLGGFIPRSLHDVAGLATPVTTSVEELMKAYRIGKDVIGGKSFEEASREQTPDVFDLANAEQTPALSKERFKAGFNTAAQALMAAGIVKGHAKAGEVPKESVAVDTASISRVPLQEEAGPSSQNPPQEIPRTEVETAIPQQKETTPQAEPSTQKTVRLYHGATKGIGQAGRDFTTSRQYAEDYAAKANGGGEVWYVDVPEGLLKTHDEYGQPMTRVIVPDEIADKAQVLTKEAPSVPNATENQPAPLIPKTDSGIKEPVSEPVNPAGQNTPELNPTSRVGIAHEYAEERFPEQIERGEGTNVETQVARGRELLTKGTDPNQIVRRVERTGKISADDMAVLRAQTEVLQHASDTAAEAARTNPGDSVLQRAADQAMQNELAWRKAVKPAATEFHKIGMTLQGQAEVNYGTFEGLRRSAVDLHGKDVTPAQAGELKNVASRVRRETQLATESMQRATGLIERRFGKKAAPRSVEQLRNDLANKIRKLTPCE